MKKCAMILNCILLTLVYIFPLGRIICACFGYRFELASNLVYAFIVAIILIGTVIVNLIAKTAITNKFLSVIFAIVIAAFLLGCTFYILEIRTMLFAICVLTCITCCFILTAKYGKPLALKITSMVLSVIMIVNLAFFGLIGFIFGDIGIDTVVKSEDSPSGKYCAQVISSDQGALGGDTVVKVSANKDLINVYLFRIYKEPKTVYFGDWMEHEGMQVYWKDDNSLIINSKEYTIY